MAKISIIKILLSFFGFFLLLFIVMGIRITSENWDLTTDITVRNLKFIGVINGIVKLPSVTCLILAMHYFLRYGYFNPKSSYLLRLTAYIIAVGAVLQLLLHLVLLYIPGRIEWGRFASTLFSTIPGLLFSIGILVLVDFLKQGRNIESENNFTI